MGFLDDLEPPASQPNPDFPAGIQRVEVTKEPPPPNPDRPSGFLDSLEFDAKNEPKPEAKVPSWSEVPGKALVNAPESAWKFAKDTVHPILHPVDTLEGIGSLLLGTMQKAGLYGGDSYKQTPEALGKMMVDRYGSIDNVKKTLANDPVGAAGDLSLLLTGGGSAAARAPGILGKAGEVVRGAGAVTDPLNMALAPAKVATGVANHVLGVTTGAGHRALEEAAHAGYEGGEAAKSFRDNMRGNVDLEDVVHSANSAMDNLRKERGSEYRKGMSGVAVNQTPVPMAAWQDISNALIDADKVQTFHGQELDAATRKVRDQVNNAVIDWMRLPSNVYHTAEGLDALKKKINNIGQAAAAGTPERAVVTKITQAIGGAIKKHVPEYAKVMEGYADASDQLRQLEKTLSLPRDERKLNIDSALRKLQSTLRNNVNTNFGQRQKMVEYLEKNGSPHLLKALAGQALNSWTPRGLARLGAILVPGLHGHGPVGAADLLSVMSPRMMGELYYNTGRFASPLKYTPLTNKNFYRGSRQVGRFAAEDGVEKARGGAVDRALRTAKRK